MQSKKGCRLGWQRTSLKSASFGNSSYTEIEILVDASYWGAYGPCIYPNWTNQPLCLDQLGYGIWIIFYNSGMSKAICSVILSLFFIVTPSGLRSMQPNHLSLFYPILSFWRYHHNFHECFVFNSISFNHTKHLTLINSFQLHSY